MPLLNDAAATWKQAVFTRYGKGDSVRTARFAYTEFVGMEDPLISAMLYDLEHDPDENHNIVTANPELQRCLPQLLGDTPVAKRNA